MTREEAIKIIDKGLDLGVQMPFLTVDQMNEAKQMAIKALEQELKAGHWIENAPEYQNIDPPYICSECGNMHLKKTNYCDQCGAKMVEPQESEESE